MGRTDLAYGGTTILTPLLRSERLVLRAHRSGDLDACAAMWGNPDVTKFIGGRTSSRHETWMRILQYRGLWDVLGYGYWAIEEISSGEYVGDVGFADFHREMEPPIAGLPEAGWALQPRFAGRGYATEALRAALAWADQHLSTNRIVCIIAAENVPSIRVAEKTGFHKVSEATFRNAPILLFDRPTMSRA